MRLFGLPRVTATFGIDPERASVGDRSSVSAAIWSGDAGNAVQEMRGQADPENHVLAIGLTPYFTEPFVNGRRLYSGVWRPGRAQLMPAGVEPRANLKGSWRMLQVYLPHAMLIRALNVESGALELIDPLGQEDKALESMGRALVDEMTRGQPMSALQIQAIGLGLGVHMVRRWSNKRATRQLARGGLASWQLKRAFEALDAHLDGAIGLEKLAGIVGCSPTHFSRAFKQSTGQPPFAWLLNRRIERAKSLLSDPRLPLAEVALAVGFSAQPQFTTAFRRVTGVTPGAWRRERLP